MQPPYRNAPHGTELPRPDEMKAAARWDDRILALVMMVLAVPRVVLAVTAHEPFGAEATIAVIVAGLGLVLMMSTRRR